MQNWKVYVADGLLIVCPCGTVAAGVLGGAFPMLFASLGSMIAMTLWIHVLAR